MQGGKKGPKEADVIDLAERRFRKKNAGPDRNQKRKVTSAECLEILRRIAPLDEKKAKELNLPKELYVGESETSFTANPDDDVAPLRNAVLMHDSPPDDLPEFAIDVTSKGSNTFCILADRKRKIVVTDSVRNMYSEQGSWKMFFTSMSDALDALKRSEKEGKKVELVMVNESMVEVREAS
jgi:hypothetical protein